MASSSKIEWTEATWNPVTGCDKVSPGCSNCYAERIASRFHQPFLGAVELHPDRVDAPFRWRKPRRVFVNSVSDLFHPMVLKSEVHAKDSPAPFLATLFAVMAAAHRHTFQILTKRPQIMRAVLTEPMFRLDVNAELLRLGYEVMPGGMTDPSFVWPPNLWFGVSVENQQYARVRIPHLLASPVAVRFLSVEPMLGPVDLMAWLNGGFGRVAEDLHWVIVGGESGPGARPMHPTWARDLRDQCVAAGVPFFFKQWGEFGPAGAWGGPDHHVTIDGRVFEPGQRIGMDHMSQPAAMHRWGKKRAGRELDGRTWDDYPA